MNTILFKAGESCKPNITETVVKYRTMKDNNRNLNKRLYIATMCSRHRDILREYDIGVELDQFCTASNMEGEARSSANVEIQELQADAHSMILHAPFNELFPAAIDPGARKLAMRRFNEASEAAASFGIRKMVVHSGYVPFVYFKEWHRDRSVEFWEEFMADKPEDFRIVIENVLDDEPYMMVEMMEQISDPRIRLCLDTGHALCVSKIPVTEWLRATAPYLGHMHIHNNDGTGDLHSDVTDGLLDMEKFLEEALELCRQDTTFTLETREGTESMKWLADKGFIQADRNTGASR